VSGVRYSYSKAGWSRNGGGGFAVTLHFGLFSTRKETKNADIKVRKQVIVNGFMIKQLRLYVKPGSHAVRNFDRPSFCPTFYAV